MAASTSVGPRGQLQFSANEAPDMGADETALSDQTAALGTRRVGTTAERNALSGAKLFVGLLWGDTTDGLEYRYTATGWKKATGLIRGGSRTATTSAGGDITITFAPPFTSACTSIVVMDSNTGAGIGSVAYKLVTKSGTAAVVRAMSPSGPVASLSTSVEYIAFGD